MMTIKAEYLNHMGDDLTIVNAARVSFDAESEWHVSHDVRESGGGTVTFSTKVYLKERDKRLLQFLARGCTNKDWSELIKRVMESNDPEEVEGLLKYVKRMPTHWSPFSHATIQMRETVPIFVARQR